MSTEGRPDGAAGARGRICLADEGPDEGCIVSRRRMQPMSSCPCRQRHHLALSERGGMCGKKRRVFLGPASGGSEGRVMGQGWLIGGRSSSSRPGDEAEKGAADLDSCLLLQSPVPSPAPRTGPLSMGAVRPIT